jgi:hypothetical protein
MIRWSIVFHSSRALLLSQPALDVNARNDAGMTPSIDLKGRALSECILLHGTTFDTAVKVVMEGFDFRLSNAGYHGRGAYFASQACKSQQYAKENLGLRCQDSFCVAV